MYCERALGVFGMAFQGPVQRIGPFLVLASCQFCLALQVAGLPIAAEQDMSPYIQIEDVYRLFMSFK
jgi:hypothetical protein